MSTGCLPFTAAQTQSQPIRRGFLTKTADCIQLERRQAAEADDNEYGCGKDVIYLGYNENTSVL